MIVVLIEWCLCGKKYDSTNYSDGYAITGKINELSKNLAKYPLDCTDKLVKVVALTEIEILRVDADLLGIMIAWDWLSDIQPKFPSSSSSWKLLGQQMDF